MLFLCVLREGGALLNTGWKQPTVIVYVGMSRLKPISCWSWTMLSKSTCLLLIQCRCSFLGTQRRATSLPSNSWCWELRTSFICPEEILDRTVPDTPLLLNLWKHVTSMKMAIQEQLAPCRSFPLLFLEFSSVPEGNYPRTIACMCVCV